MTSLVPITIVIAGIVIGGAASSAYITSCDPTPAAQRTAIKYEQALDRLLEEQGRGRLSSGRSIETCSGTTTWGIALGAAIAIGGVAVAYAVGRPLIQSEGPQNPPGEAQ